MFEITFDGDAFATDFSFDFTTDLPIAVIPDITIEPGDINVIFPPIGDVVDANSAPVLTDDSAQTEEGTAVTIAVLANDTDTEGDPIRLLAASDPANGTVSVDGDTVIYTPDDGFSGTDSFTYKVFDGFKFAEGNVSVEVAPDETEEMVGDKSGFELANVNSWYNPAWGGGYIASFEYTVSDASIIGEDLYAWTIDSGYSGGGSIVNVWASGFGGPASAPSDGSYDIGNIDAGYRPELKVGDTFTVSFEIEGAGFDAGHFCPIFVDHDPDPFDATAADVAIDAAPTNDWGSGFLQTVKITNLTEEEIDGWSVLLDVPDGDTFVFNSVWGATAETQANGDILFSNLSWNEDINAGGAVNFGFSGDNATEDAVVIDDFDFTWLG